MTEKPGKKIARLRRYLAAGLALGREPRLRLAPLAAAVTAAILAGAALSLMLGLGQGAGRDAAMELRRASGDGAAVALENFRARPNAPIARLARANAARLPSASLRMEAPAPRGAPSRSGASATLRAGSDAPAAARPPSDNGPIPAADNAIATPAARDVLTADGRGLNIPQPELLDIATEPDPLAISGETARGAAVSRADPAASRAERSPVVSGAPPRVAIVIDDLGLDVAAAERVAQFPAPLTLSYLAYSDRSKALAEAARLNGHEIWLHLPMEPEGDDDPGRNALLTGLDEAEVTRRIDWHLSRMPPVSGVNNHMGSRFTADTEEMRPVLAVLRRKGLLFLDSLTTPDSVAGRLAGEMGLFHASRDVFLDSPESAVGVRGRLAEAEEIARRRGEAIVIAHPHDETLDVLGMWLVTAPLRGFEVVPLSELIVERRLASR